MTYIFIYKVIAPIYSTLECLPDEMEDILQFLPLLFFCTDHIDKQNGK